MNWINSNITGSSYSLTFVKTRTDPIYDKFQFGYPETIRHSSIPIPLQKLTKPLSQPFHSNTETPNINFDLYTEAQKALLLNLYNQTDISYPTHPSTLKTISGTVTKNEQITPYAEVRVHDKISGKVIKKVWADQNGAFTIADLYYSRDWYIVAFDYKGEMNAVVLSGVRT